jgi:hypothetical protein
VSKSKGRSRHQGIVHTTRTTEALLPSKAFGRIRCSNSKEGIINGAYSSAVPTSVASTEALLPSKALGRIRCSNGKEGIVDGAYSSALGKLMLTMTTAARAPASTSGRLPRRVRCALC